VKRVINDNKVELEKVIERLSQTESVPWNYYWFHF
jgi:hypothetical protein